MKNTFRRIALLMLCVIMTASAVCGCGKKDEKKEKVDLSWYINFSWFTTGWGDNMVSKAITEKTGCNIEFVVPTGDPNEKLDSMIASNTLPDIVTLGWWEPEINQMINDKIVYALDELADKYDTYFYDVVNEQVVKWYTSEDGHIYQYPNSACSPSDYEEYDNLASNETFLVRKDIYEAIGKPDMTTPEGFVKAVEKAAEMFPTIDGKELIPVGCTEFNDIGCDSFDNYLMDFLAVPYADENGNALDRHKNSDLVMWLKAFRQLGSEGLLKDEIFLDTRTQMSEKIANGQYFCMIYQYTDMEAQEKTLYANNPDSIYIAVDGPKNSAGDDYTLPGTSVNGWTVTMVSKNCKYPDRAIQLLTYLMSEEGQKMTWLGVEGKTWDYDSDGVPVMKKEVQDLLNSDRAAYDEKYGADSCYWMMQNGVMASQWIKDDENNPITQLKQWTYPYTVYVGQYTITLDTTTQVGKIKNMADTLWGKTLPKLLLAEDEKEFDKIYNNFIKERYQLGYDQVLDTLTVKIKENTEKLGLD
ncbi:MAG: extracellular solute-binding protein [Eubacterium sp.]